MTYQLLIGQRGHSSWSLRGWLPFAVFDIDVAVQTTRIYSDEFAAEVAAFGGAGTVPVVRTPEGGLLTDSIAIAWHLAEAFPDRGLLPTDPQDRAEAISLIAEMHSGFTALRGACPMNLYTGWAGLRDAARGAGRSRPDRRDLVPRARPLRRAVPLRDYTLADAFYAPVATRIATYGLSVSDTALAYVRPTWNSPSSAAGAPWGWPRGRN
jgi:glutathione S-transferase